MTLLEGLWQYRISCNVDHICRDIYCIASQRVQTRSHNDILHDICPCCTCRAVYTLGLQSLDQSQGGRVCKDVWTKTCHAPLTGAHTHSAECYAYYVNTRQRLTDARLIPGISFECPHFVALQCSCSEYSLAVVTDSMYFIQNNPASKETALAQPYTQPQVRCKLSLPHNGAHQRDKLGCLAHHCGGYSNSCR